MNSDNDIEKQSPVQLDIWLIPDLWHKLDNMGFDYLVMPECKETIKDQDSVKGLGRKPAEVSTGQRGEKSEHS